MWFDYYVGFHRAYVFSFLEITFNACRAFEKPIEEWGYQHGHTTLTQFILNLIIMPLLVYWYHRKIANHWTRILLFPIVLWICEIIQGTLLVLYYGHNPIWNYTGDYAYFGGMIRLDYVHWWLFCGILEVIGWELLFRDPNKQSAAERYWLYYKI